MLSCGPSSSALTCTVHRWGLDVFHELRLAGQEHLMGCCCPSRELQFARLSPRKALAGDVLPAPVTVPSILMFIAWMTGKGRTIAASNSSNQIGGGKQKKTE